MKNSDFLKWARGEKPEDDARWEEWVKVEPLRRAVLENAIALVNSVEANSLEVSDIYVEHRIRQALRIAKNIEEERRRNKVVRLFARIKYRWAVAASLIVALGIGLLLYGSVHSGEGSALSKIGEGEYTGLTEIKNSDGDVKYVRLPDGSSVVLQGYSSIRHPRQFDPAKREVYLSGEAFFEVTKNPEQPFYVYANELVAQVHGTSFSIRAGRKDGQVEVAVKTGKVYVYSHREAESANGEPAARLVLTQNEQASFDRTNLTLVRSTQKSSVLLNLAIEHQPFTYSEAPVGEVFAALGNAYGVDIDYNKDQMANCSITATLGDEPLENKIRWICTILEADYEITEEKIRIKGNSCL
ncbi:FecR family protein [Telluribacter sp. SYSU D00476]|uniref:FecR family protein n=1 Tax=Telluribacter sp. SYSU D00476 TaxID=2811430 RepID=UPI001FF5561A|nr:FecR family protein [Telluribacter sp. SYSU D00476]